MREHRGSNAGEQDVQATVNGRAIGKINNININIDTSSLQATVDDMKWQMKPPIEVIPLSIGGKMRFKGDNPLTKEITMHVSREMHKALRKEVGLK